MFCITYNLKLGAFWFRTARLFSYKGVYNFFSKDVSNKITYYYWKFSPRSFKLLNIFIASEDFHWKQIVLIPHVYSYFFNSSNQNVYWMMSIMHMHITTVNIVQSDVTCVEHVVIFDPCKFHQEGCWNSSRENGRNGYERQPRKQSHSGNPVSTER